MGDERSQSWFSGHLLDVSHHSSPSPEGHLTHPSVIGFDSTAVGGTRLSQTDGDESTDFEVVLGVRAGNVRLFLRGELDSSGVPKLSAILGAATGSGLRVIVDCAELSFIDAAGIRALLHGRNGCEDFAMVNCQEPVRRVIEVLALEQLLSLT